MALQPVIYRVLCGICILLCYVCLMLSCIASLNILFYCVAYSVLYCMECIVFYSTWCISPFSLIGLYFYVLFGIACLGVEWISALQCNAMQIQFWRNCLTNRKQFRQNCLCRYLHCIALHCSADIHSTPKHAIPNNT